jgi:hypothetical protein
MSEGALSEEAARIESLTIQLSVVDKALELVRQNRDVSDHDAWQNAPRPKRQQQASFSSPASSSSSSKGGKDRDRSFQLDASSRETEICPYCLHQVRV